MKNEADEACGMYERKESCLEEFCRETQRKEEGNIKMIFSKLVGGVLKWISLAQGRYKQRILLNTVTLWGRNFTFKFQHTLYLKCE